MKRSRPQLRFSFYELLPTHPGQQLAALAEVDAIREQVHVGQLWRDGEALSRMIVKLASYNAYLGELVAQAEDDQNAAEAHYKLTCDNLILDMSRDNATAPKEERMTVDAIRAQVNLDTQTELGLYNQARKNYKVLSLKRVDTNNLLDAMRSRLSWMKKERES